MTPAETLAKSKQLDRFLGKAVGQLKQADQASMNKFAELAAKIRANREAMEAEADDLNIEADKTMSMFMDAAGQNRSMLTEAREGAQAMKDAALGMAGHNGAPLEVSPPAAPPSPPVIEPPVIEPPAPAPIVMPVSVDVATVEPERVVDLVPEPVAPPPVPVMDPTATGNPPA